MKDLKFVCTNISVSFLVQFQNGLRKETEILVEINFRSFAFYLPFQMLLLVIVFAIKLLAQVNMFQTL